MTRTRLIDPADTAALAGQQDVIAESLSRYASGQQVPYAILDDAETVVGRINLNNVVRGAFQSASVGYWLAEEAGGRGFATEAVAEIVALGFGELGFHRLEAGTVPENLRSQAVLLRNGFEQYGYAPRYLSIAGRWQDHLLFQRLRLD